MKPKLLQMVRSTEMAVFVESSLGTHLALSAPPDIWAGDLKRKIESEHCHCFPSINKIRVLSLMVKHKSLLYHLPDSIPAKEACQGFAGTCFLYMVASELAGITTEESAPPLTVSKCRKLESIDQSETIKPSSCAIMTSENLTSKSNLPTWKTLRAAYSTRVDMNYDTVGTSSYSGYLADSSDPNNFSRSRFRVTRTTSQVGKSERDYSAFNEHLAVFFLPSSSSQNKSKRRKKEISIDIKQSEKGLGPYQTGSRSEFSHGPNFGQGKQTNKPPGVGLKDKTLLSENNKRNFDEISSSTEEISPGSLSEKISVTGLISRYFSDGGEVNSASMPLGNAVDAEKLKLQSDDTLKKRKEYQQKKVTGCESRQFDVFCTIARNLERNKITDVADERELQDTSTKSTEIEYSSSSQVDKNRAGNKFSRHRSVNNRKLVRKGQRMGASTSQVCKYRVGKRLIQAANKIWSSDSVKRSSSMYLSKCMNMPSHKLSDLVKRYSFEMSDSSY